MASTKRYYPGKAEQSDSKRPKKDDDKLSALVLPTKLRVALNPADCNLDFNIDCDGQAGYALYEGGFAYCWSGARANVGISRGRYCFGCKVISEQPVVMEDTPRDQRHVCRVGISRGDDAVGNLGETPHSYGFGGTGKFSTAGKFSDYGERFGCGDLIVCAIDLENKPHASISFFKNGISLGVAKHFDAGPEGLAILGSEARERQWESAVFPHVLLKNVHVQMLFSTEEGLIPPNGYEPWAAAIDDGNAVFGPSFNDPKECEVIMMVGLPASGKSTWAEKWVSEHPEKRYILLGTNLALEQMKVPGLLRKHNYSERFDRLMDRATGIFNTLLSRAAKTPCNYIIDQTNVYKSARKRKLKPFALYRKIAVVIVPTQEELKLRARRRFSEMGKEVPPDAVNEMLVNFVLPTSKDMRGADEYFDEVIFPELNRDEARSCLDDMKRALAVAIPKSDESPLSHETRAFSDPRFFRHSVAGSPHCQSQPSRVPGAGWQQDPHAQQPQLSYDRHPLPNVASVYRGSEQSRELESFSGPYRANVNYAPGRAASFESKQWHDYESNRSRRIVDPGVKSDSYPMYASGNPCSLPYVRMQNSAPAASMAFEYRTNLDPAYGYAPPADSGRNTVSYGGNHGAEANFRPPTEPAFQQNSVPYGFGSPYPTPNPRPPGNFSGSRQHYRGSYAAPPRYF